MKAVQIIDGAPTFTDVADPMGEGVEVRVASAGICGSDIHLIDAGYVEGRILGHEISGFTSDGTPVVVEPLGRCTTCGHCVAGNWHHCASSTIYGIAADGGMAERIIVPSYSVVALPDAITAADASLVEPLAVAVHAVHRARIARHDRVAVVGAGPIGLAVVAVCADAGIPVHISARHEHQRLAAEALGAVVGLDGEYDVVFDAAGNATSLAEAITLSRPQGRVCLVGSLWEPAAIDMNLCRKEVEIVPATIYCEARGVRDFDEAAALLSRAPQIASVMVTHRFPLDGAAEAFEAARNRSSGAIKVAFDIGA